MARITIPVDKNKLTAAIKQVEANGPLAEGKTKLYELVSALYNHVYKPEMKLSAAVVGLRIAQFNIEVQTKSNQGRGRKGFGRVPGQKMNRVPRQEKFAGSAVIQSSIKQIRANTPARFLPLVDAVEKGSRTAAVKLNCLECSGYVTSEVRNCACPQCPLFPFRPFQSAIEPDEDSVEVDDTDESAEMQEVEAA